MVAAPNSLIGYGVAAQTHAIGYPRHCKVGVWQPEEYEVTPVSGPDQLANSWNERPARQRRFESETPPSLGQRVEPPQHQAAGCDRGGLRSWQAAGQHIRIDEFGHSQDIDEQLARHRRLAGAVWPCEDNDGRLLTLHDRTLRKMSTTRQEKRATRVLIDAAQFGSGGAMPRRTRAFVNLEPRSAQNH